MATVGIPEGLFSTLLFGDDDDFESFLADDLAAFRSRIETSHRSTQSTSSPSLVPYLFLMGDDDEALIIAEEAGAENAPNAQPTKSEFIGNLEDVRVKESDSVCSICLDEMSIGCEAKRLPCSHIYHGGCIGGWLEKTNTCPICRRQMPSSS